MTRTFAGNISWFCVWVNTRYLFFNPSRSVMEKPLLKLPSKLLFSKNQTLLTIRRLQFVQHSFSDLHAFQLNNIGLRRQIYHSWSFRKTLSLLFDEPQPKISSYWGGKLKLPKYDEDSACNCKLRVMLVNRQASGMTSNIYNVITIIAIYRTYILPYKIFFLETCSI